MKRFALILVLLAGIAAAQQLNSSSFKVTSDVLDSSGGRQNSSSYILQDSLGSISGDFDSSSFSMTGGFISTLALSANAPQIMNQTISGSSWNLPINFTVLTRDVDNETVTVTFYTSNDNVTFTQRGTATCATCSGVTQFNFSLNVLTCADAGPQYFKFLANDGSMTNETGKMNFTVLRGYLSQSNVTITEGAVQQINTHSTINLTVQLRNATNAILSDTNATIFVQNLGAYNRLSCTTNSTGHCRVSLTPDCSYSGGGHSFIGGIFNDTCYLDTNTTASTFTIDALAFCNRVAFKLAFNIQGSANDNTYADTKGAGFYRADNVSRHYACIEDTSLQDSFSIVRTGSQLDYINVSSGSMTVSETQEGNRFAIPVVGETCSFIGGRNLQHPLQPFISTGESLGAIELLLEYPEIDIVGNDERTGAFTVVMERNLTNDKQLIVDII